MEPQKPGSPSDSTKKPSLHPSLLQKLLKEGTEDYYKEDCPECGEENCFVEIPDYLYEIPEENISEVLPAWVCSQCGYEAFEEESMEIVLNLQAKVAGKHYQKIFLKDGKKNVRTIH